MESVTFGDSLTNIYVGAFENCTSLKKVKIPDSVTILENYAFKNCTMLMEASLGNSLNTIGYQAFYGCTMLSRVMIGDSVTTIHDEAFENCSRLRGAYFKGNAPITFGRRVFDGTREKFSIYYQDGALRWTNPWNGYTAVRVNSLQDAYNNQKEMEKQEAQAVTIKGLKAEWSYDSIKIFWTENKMAESYTVYRSTSKNGTYKAIATITDTYYYDKKVKSSATTYYYKVRATMKVEGSNYQGKLSSAKSFTTPIPLVTISSVKNLTGRKAVVKWKKVSGVTGYEIYRAEGYMGKYKKVKIVTKNSTVSFTNTKLKKGKSYYYKIRAYKTVDGKKVYGNDSYSYSVYISK